MQKNSVNKVVLVGHLGANPLGRYTAQGRSAVSFSVATNESWKDNNDRAHEHVEWHNVFAWDRLADFANQYLYKGQLVYVEGSIRTRSWEDKEGVARKSCEILCSSIVPLEWKTSGK